MIRFSTKILQFGEQGEKTGWTYIIVPMKLAQQLMPGKKTSFRVKGRLDEHMVKAMALLPRGNGDYILVLNATIRKAIRKRKGDALKVELEVDKKPVEPPKDLLECLADEPEASVYFKSLPKSHQNYFGNWVKTAKTPETRARRIARIVTAMLKKQTYAEMIRAHREDRLDLRG